MLSEKSGGIFFYKKVVKVQIDAETYRKRKMWKHEGRE